MPDAYFICDGKESERLSPGSNHPRNSQWLSASVWLLRLTGAVTALVVLLALLHLAGVWPFPAARASAAASPIAATAPAGTRQPEAKPAASTEAEAALQAQLGADEKNLESQIAARQKQTDDRLAEQMQQSKELLDALVVLTGLGSLLIGFLTYMNVKYAREEAKDQVEIFRKKIEEIEQKFPEFGGLDERVQRLVREVELRMPAESDWNDEKSYGALTESEREAILDNEVTLAASSSVFALERSVRLRISLVSIHCAFARFYLARWKASADPEERDYVRALSHASRAVAINPEGSAAYRIRGVIHLARYERDSNANPPPNAEKLKQMLDDAELDLKTAASRDDLVDAGAYFNLALLEHYRGKTEDAANTCRRLLRLRKKISPMHREKYLPDTYRNLACFLAILAHAAATAGDPRSAERLSKEAVAVLKDGVEDFQKTARLDRGLDALRKGVEKELSPGGDLNSLQDLCQQQITALFLPPPG
jgi:tetratricopeptide (TPR) repeat protein